MKEFFEIRIKALWAFFWREHFSFWAICAYLFFEYVRPQSIYPWLNFMPWGQVLLGLSLLGFLADRSAKRVKNPLNIWMTLFLILIVVSSFFAYRPDLSWPKFMDFFGWFVIYFLIINIVNSEKRLFIFLLVFLLASFKLSFHGAKTWASRGFAFESWGLSGPPGYFENSGELAVQMLMFAPIAYRVVAVIKPHLSRFKFLVGMMMPLTAMMTIMGASSRGGQVGLLLQLYQTFLKGRLSFKAIIVVAALLGGAYLLMPAEQLARFENSGSDRTSQQRLLYWKRGVQMMEEHPGLGVGYFNFAVYFEDHFPEDMLYGSAQLPHNIFVQVGTDMGVTGLAVYLALILGSLRTTAKIRSMLKDQPDHWLSSLSLGLDGALIGFVVAGQFVTIAYYPFMWVNLAFVVAAFSITKNLSAELQRSEVRQDQVLPRSWNQGFGQKISRPQRGR